MKAVEISKHFQVALLYNTPKTLNKVSYKIEGAELFVLAVFDCEPKQFELDCIYSVVAEVLGHYSSEYTYSVSIQITGSQPQDLAHLIFARYEADEY